MSLSASQPKRIVVLGAGVVGLTTAVRILEARKGKWDVTVVGETLPSDEKNIRYTSWWAGAQIETLATEDARYRKIQTDTFEEMWKLGTAALEGDDVETRDRGIFKKVKNRRYLEMKLYDESLSVEQEHPCGYMPGFRYLTPEELEPLVGRTPSSVLRADGKPKPPAQGTEVTTLTTHSHKYVLYLVDRFLKAGGKLIKAYVWHINAVLEGLDQLERQPPDAVIVCTGLGTRFLGGVEDKNMFAIRGQTVVVNAPWVDELPEMGYTLEDDELGDKRGGTYIIPRGDGTVVVGGTFHEDDWYPHPRPVTGKRILERAVRFYPQLAPPEVREKKKEGKEVGLEDVEGIVIEHAVGLRPGRKGGIRLEVEKMEWDAKDGKGKRTTPVVHNYGHGSGGFQCSWGSANVALELLESALQADGE
ncbi:hypothetical protein D9758_009208 [Tetrapyrgos nigripes]|uniref:FAD dependent oxidoreductase domain-containing protein n=1 Tax=Tetrapyrgos nigripes TaxID=182062 RepID=A0A8H5FXB1_9AGAR|nr:hypothetical protein D9758_009208 [Tetrapyrgos nigripes]